ncbi:endonuclease NucS domain-containing protein [Streptomyces sp. NPDC093510]|uniref:endonuclease NucS domain-containing protein n=1 Tax=Streptomyces sp. NPDC093510 TaxID=3155199 RepID=UPI0034210ED5
MAVLKLFKTAGGVKEVSAHLAEVEADVQDLVEAHMETMLGVTFLASEYVIDCVDGGRIDSLGLDENGSPVIVEYKRGTDAGVINQGLYYMAWLTNHKDAFRNLVRDRLGATASSQILWSAPRLICVAGDFTRYDAHAVREHRRSIDLVRYRYFGSDHFGLETVASVTGHPAPAKRVRRRAAGVPVRERDSAMAELAQAVDEVLVGLGDGVTRVQRKQYRAYRRLRNFASVGTGDLELQLRTERDLERAGDLLRLSYAAA